MNDELIDDLDNETQLSGLTTFMDRVRHFYVDWILIFFTTLIIYFNLVPESLSEFQITPFIIFLFFYLLYYLLLETTTSRTIGKYLNKTKVLNENGLKPTFNQVLIRTVTRLIPFGFVLIQTPYLKPLHDLLSKTFVVRIK